MNFFLKLVLGFCGFVFLNQTYKFYRTKTSLFFKHKKALEEVVKFEKSVNNWKELQNLNLRLCWLDTLSWVNESEGSNFESKFNLSKLKIQDLRSYQKWKLNNTFNRLIIRLKIEIENSLTQGGFTLFLPESILPFSTEIIRKAFLFQFDWIRYNSGFSENSKRIEVDKVSELQAKVFLRFRKMDYDNHLTKTPTFESHKYLHNYNLGKESVSTFSSGNDYEYLRLIDWRTDEQWIERAKFWVERNETKYAIECYKKIDKKNKNRKVIEDLIKVKQ